MSEARSSGLKRMLLAGGAIGVVWLAYALRAVIIPLFIAFLIAYALDPIVDRLESWRVPRSLGAVLVMFALIGVIVVIALLGVPWLIDEFLEAAHRLPDQLRSLQERAEAFFWIRFHYNLPTTWAELMAKYGSVIRDRMPDASGVVTAAFSTVNAILFFVGMAIIPFFAVYLLIDFHRLVTRTEALIPRRWAPDIRRLAQEIHTTLGRYIRGQLIAIVVLSALYSSALSIVGLRLAVPIGILTGCLAFVPYIGLGIGTSCAAVMALLDWHSTAHFVSAVGVMLVIGFLDGMVITPRIVGGSVGLKPLEVLLTMMAAATIFGFLGVLLAVPLGAVLKILIGHLVDYYLGSPFYRRPPSLAPPRPFPSAPPMPIEPPRARAEVLPQERVGEGERKNLQLE